MAISQWVAVGALVCLAFSGYLVHSRRDLTKDTESYLEHMGSDSVVHVKAVAAERSDSKAEVHASESLVQIGAMLGSATDYLAEAVYNVIPPTNGLGNPGSDNDFIPPTTGSEKPLAGDNPEAVHNIIPPTTGSEKPVAGDTESDSEKPVSDAQTFQDASPIGMNVAAHRILQTSATQRQHTQRQVHGPKESNDSSEDESDESEPYDDYAGLNLKQKTIMDKVKNVTRPGRSGALIDKTLTDVMMSTGGSWDVVISCSDLKDKFCSDLQGCISSFEEMVEFLEFDDDIQEKMTDNWSDDLADWVSLDTGEGHEYEELDDVFPNECDEEDEDCNKKYDEEDVPAKKILREAVKIPEVVDEFMRSCKEAVETSKKDCQFMHTSQRCYRWGGYPNWARQVNLGSVLYPFLSAPRGATSSNENIRFLTQQAEHGITPTVEDVKDFLALQTSTRILANFSTPDRSLETWHFPTHNLVEMNAAEGSLVFVIGDIHGRLDEMLFMMSQIKESITQKMSKPEDNFFSDFLVCKPGVYYIFMGDYVDRAPKIGADLSTMLLALLYRWMCPVQEKRTHGVLLLRGNHEDVVVNKRYGFMPGAFKYGIHWEKQGKEKEEELLKLEHLFAETFQTLPIIGVLNKAVLFTHGGMSQDSAYDQHVGDYGKFVKDINKLENPQGTCERNGGSRVLHVSNLPADVTESELRLAFEVYGKVSSVSIEKQSTIEGTLETANLELKKPLDELVNDVPEGSKAEVVFAIPDFWVATGAIRKAMKDDAAKEEQDAQESTIRDLANQNADLESLLHEFGWEDGKSGCRRLGEDEDDLHCWEDWQFTAWLQTERIEGLIKELDIAPWKRAASELDGTVHRSYSWKVERAFNTLCNFMWSDPQNDVSKWDKSPRGQGSLFGNQAFLRFADSTGIELFVRGHQAMSDGFFQEIPNVFTVFSAAAYQAGHTKGAFASMVVPPTVSQMVKSSLCAKYSMMVHRFGHPCEYNDITGKAYSCDLPNAIEDAKCDDDGFKSQFFAQKIPDIDVNAVLKDPMVATHPDCAAMFPKPESTEVQVSKILQASRESKPKYEVAEFMRVLDEFSEAAPLEDDPQKLTTMKCEALLVSVESLQVLRKQEKISDDKVASLKKLIMERTDQHSALLELATRAWKRSSLLPNLVRSAKPGNTSKAPHYS